MEVCFGHPSGIFRRRVGFFRASYQPVGQAATYTTYNKHQRLTSTPLILILTRDPSNQEASGLRLRPL